MSELVLVCCRCDRSIKDDEPYNKHDHDRASGPPVVTYTHRACPAR